MGILPNNADCDCFKTPILQVSRIENLHQVEHWAFWEVIRLFQSVGCVRTSVSLSSRESEIIPLDTGLRLDGITALNSWDLIVAVLGNTNQSNKHGGLVSEPT